VTRDGRVPVRYVQPPPPPPPLPPLPYGWTKHIDDNNGQYYYHNNALDYSTWMHPGLQRVATPIATRVDTPLSTQDTITEAMPE
jgi:hypothetical protein